MKKQLCTLLLFSTSLSLPVMAHPHVHTDQHPHNSFHLKAEDKQLLAKPVESLSHEERVQLYNQNYKDPNGAMLKNLAGFGWGSYSLGDEQAGNLLAIGDGLTYGFVAYVLLMANGIFPSNGLFSNEFALGMLGVLVLTKAYGVISPYSYSEQYNRELRNYLSLGAQGEELRHHGGGLPAVPQIKLFSYSTSF